MNDSAPPLPGDHLTPGFSAEEKKWACLAQQCRYRREALAKMLQVSQRTLDRYFKKHLGTGPSAWLRELQLNDAYQQIVAGKSLKEAAYEVGFKQASHFSRRFKGRFGIQPSLLRGSPHQVIRARLDRTTEILSSRMEGELSTFSNRTIQPHSRELSPLSLG